MNNITESTKWKISLGVSILVAAIATCFQINSLQSEMTIKFLSIVITIISFIFLYLILYLYIDICILKDDINDMKKFY